jgi:riboflavin biosynthesis pyrimidine reductase
MLQRFDEVVRRKRQEAIAATLPPLQTVELGTTTDLDVVGSPWTRRLFDGDFYLSKPPQDIPATGLVFVQSSDGNTGARNPESLGGGQTDKHLIYEGLSRVAADGVLAGAETIRGSQLILSVWRPELVELRASLGLPRHPVQIVATLGALRLHDTLLFNTPEIRVVVIATPAWVKHVEDDLAQRPWIETVEMAHSHDLPSAFRVLRSMGIARLSAIGGRAIARSLLDAGLIQDLYLTTAAIPGGEPNTPLYPTPIVGRVVVKKCGTGAEKGVTFQHVVI